MRFVWTSDAEGVLGGFADLARIVGPRNVPARGEDWASLSQRLALDPQGRLAETLASQRTFTGVECAWSVDGAPFDFSFSGLKTFVINLLHNAEQRGEQISVPDLAASYRKAVVDCLLRNFLAAAEETGSKKLVVAGGVSANSLLRRRLAEECEARGWEFYRPELQYCGDNAAMVGSQGYYEFLVGSLAGPDLNARPEMPVEQNFILHK